MKKITLVLLIGIFCNSFTKGQIVTTLAGTINAGAGNGTGSSVGFDQPAGIVSDGSGNLYIADQDNNEVRKIVISSGTVSLFAGSGGAGSGNGSGSAVTFNQPEGIALDGNGNMFVSELNNNDIRKIVISTGAVTTLAGNLTAGSTNGTGTGALFSAPSGLASDGTNLYVADHSNNEIRKIVISSGVVTTLAGSTTLGHANGTGAAASFYYPYGIVYDGAGNLYVAEQDNNDIRKIVIATGVVTTLAGCQSCTAGTVNGVGTTATFNTPYGLGIDANGNLYVADATNNEIRKIVISSATVSTYAGTTTYGSANGTGTAASFHAPTGIATDASGNVYVADQDNNEIREVTTAAPIVSIAGDSVPCSGTSQQFYDQSTNTPTSWKWTFTGATPATSTLQNPTVVYNAAGNYTVKLVATNAYGSDSLTKTNWVAVNATPTITISAQSSSICVGASDTLTASGAANYVWSPSTALSNPSVAKVIASPTTTTTYTVNGFGVCSSKDSVKITVNPKPTVNVTSTPQYVCLGKSSTLKATGASTYAWSPTATLSAPSGDSVYATPTTTATVTYTVFGTSSAGCISTAATVNVGVYALPSTPTVSSNSPVCAGQPLNLTTPSGSVAYSWTGPNSYTSSTQNPTISVTTTANSGTYSVVATASVTGCQSLPGTGNVVVNALPTITITPASASICLGKSDTLTASGATSYTWSPQTNLSTPSSAQVIASSTTTTTYTVTGVYNGCSNTKPITVTVNPLPPNPNVGSNGPICSGNALNLTATSTGASTYSWTGPNSFTSNTQNPTITAASTVATGTYSVIAQSSLGCNSSGAGTLAVTVNATPTLTITSTNPSVCPGGSSYLTANGANSYVWTAAASLSAISMGNATATPTATTSYKVTGTSINGCTAVDSTTVIVENLAITLNTVNESCNGLTNGNITATVTGGTPTYKYSWNNGGTTNLIYNLATGGYTVTVTDNIGCTGTASTTVTQPSALSVSATATNTSCGKSSGSVTASPTGGVPPYNYSWTTTPVETGDVVTGLASGTYSVTLTDGTGCTANAKATVGGSNSPTINATFTNSTCGTPDGKAKVTVTNGTPPYRYSWNNGDTLSTDSNMAAATYVITVTDAAGCLTFEPVNINDATGPTITINSVTNVTCNGGSNGAIAITATGGAGGYKYKWSNGATTASISGLSAGPYLITVTDVGGCVAVNTITITEPTVLAGSVSITAASCGTSNGGAGVLVSGGSSPYVYSWNTGATVYNLTNVAAGTYTLTVTDKNGCTLTSLASVDNASGPLVTLDSVINMNCATKTLGEILISTSGGTPPYAYLWSNSATTQNVSGLNAGNYAVTVTDAAGCKGTGSASITTALPPGMPICMVTVNPKTNFNTLIWDSINPNRIQEYLIYRQTTTPGVYTVIGHSAGNSGTFVDTLSNAGKRSWWYELSELDSCGQASPIGESILFKTIHLTATLTSTSAVNLVWDNFEGATFQRYIIYRDTVAGIVSDSIASVDTNTFGYVDHPPYTTKTYYYHIGIGGNFGCSLVPRALSINYNASKSNTGNITVKNTTGIPTISSVNSLTVFPNPNRGMFTMSLDIAKQENIRVRIYDALGKAIEEDSYSAQSGKLLKQYDLSAFSKGVYTVQVISDDGVTYRKVVIQ